MVGACWWVANKVVMIRNSKFDARLVVIHIHLFIPICYVARLGSPEMRNEFIPIVHTFAFTSR